MSTYNEKEWQKKMDNAHNSTTIASAYNTTVVEIGETKSYSSRYQYNHIIIEPTTVVSSITKHYSNDKIIAVVNDGSYLAPGGDGKKRQKSSEEEILCSSSNLLSILSSLQGVYYEPNQKRKNKGLYHNNLLYIPNVKFNELRPSISDHSKETNAFVDVITIASPDKKNLEVLEDRMTHLLAIAGNKKVDTLIINDFGCDISGLDIEKVAFCYSELLDRKFWKVFETVIFAMDNKDHYTIFKKVFERDVTIEVIEDGKKVSKKIALQALRKKMQSEGWIDYKG